MRDQWEVRISAIENIQEEFGHDIREIKERLAKLTDLFEHHIKIVAAHPRNPSLLPNQQVPRPFIQTTSHLPNGTHRPNLRQPMPTTPPTFMATSRPIDQPSGSRGKPNGQKTGKDKIQQDPIPITYTELLPKLIESGFIAPFYLAPLRPPFPKWYNANNRCDYHVRNPGHSTENYSALKYKVQSLIKDGKLRFEESDELVRVENPSRTKTEMTRQDKRERPQGRQISKKR